MIDTAEENDKMAYVMQVSAAMQRAVVNAFASNAVAAAEKRVLEPSTVTSSAAAHAKSKRRKKTVSIDIKTLGSDSSSSRLNLFCTVVTTHTTNLASAAAAATTTNSQDFSGNVCLLAGEVIPLNPQMPMFSPEIGKNFAIPFPSFDYEMIGLASLNPIETIEYNLEEIRKEMKKLANDDASLFLYEQFMSWGIE